MTNVALTDITTDSASGATSGSMVVTGEKCLKVTITPAKWVANKAYVDSVKVEKVGSPTKNACKAVQGNPQVVKFVNAEFASKKCKTLETGNNGCKEWDTADETIKGFPASGLKVVY